MIRYTAYLLMGNSRGTKGRPAQYSEMRNLARCCGLFDEYHPIWQTIWLQGIENRTVVEQKPVIDPILAWQCSKSEHDKTS